MAHHELKLNSNAIDVAFSKSNSRFAVLMKDHFSVFLWPIKNKLVQPPVLESSHQLPEAPESRPRQIAFLNENEVYILRDNGPNNTQIECTALETRSTKIVHKSGESEQLYSIFTAVGHVGLWFSHTLHPGMIISYSSITSSSSHKSEITAWNESAAINIYWAKAVQIPDEKVCLNHSRLSRSFLTFIVPLNHLIPLRSAVCK